MAFEVCGIAPLGYIMYFFGVHDGDGPLAVQILHTSKAMVLSREFWSVGPEFPVEMVRPDHFYLGKMVRP